MSFWMLLSHTFWNACVIFWNICIWDAALNILKHRFSMRDFFVRTLQNHCVIILERLLVSSSWIEKRIWDFWIIEILELAFYFRGVITLGRILKQLWLFFGNGCKSNTSPNYFRMIGIFDHFWTITLDRILKKQKTISRYDICRDCRAWNFHLKFFN